MKRPHWLTLVFILALSSALCAGKPGEKGKRSDTLLLSDIPIRSAELVNHARHEFHDIIPANTIKKLRIRNRIVLSSVDTALLTPPDANDASLNLRDLENRLVHLQIEQRNIEKEEKELSAVFNSLDGLSTWLREESEIWKVARTRLLADSQVRIVPEKLSFTIAFIDSCLALLGKKNSAVMEMLEQTIAIGVNIDLSLEKTSLLIYRKEMNAFAADQLPLLSLNLSSNYASEFRESLKLLTSVRLRELTGYMQSRAGSVALLAGLFFGIVWFFRILKRRIRISATGTGAWYKQMLARALESPAGAATILSLASTLLIFPDRPVIFRELTTYIIAYPLVAALARILDRRFHKYLVGFSIIIVLYILSLLVSNDTVTFRLLLLLIALAEIGLIGLLLVRFMRSDLASGNRKLFIALFILLHLALAATGLISNFTGRVILTEMTLNAVFSNIFSGVVLFITVVILNGIIATGIDSGPGQRLNSIRGNSEILKKKIIILFNIVALVLWFTFILGAFRLDGLVYDAIASVFTYTFTIGTASFSLDLVVLFFAVILLAWYTAGILQQVLEKDLLGRMPLSKGLPHTISMGLKYVLIVLGTLLAFSAAGIPMDKVTIILGAFSVGIGFGLQNIFSNMVSGLILLFERPIQLGDTVQVGVLTGEVKSIDLRSSNIRTFDGAEVIVPNSQLVSNEVINWTLSDKKRRIEVRVGVGYGSDPRQVQELLLGILLHHPEVVQDPDPLVFFTELGESSLDFLMVFWIPDYNEGRRLKSEVLFTVFSILKENGITIPFPQRDLHIISPPGMPAGETAGD